MPDIVPPVMVTAPALCVDIVLKPRLSLAPVAFADPVPPLATGIGALRPETVPPVITTPLMVPPSNAMLPVFMTAMLPSCSPDLAPAGVPDPVPPSVTAKGVMPDIAPPVMFTALAFC